MMVAVLLAVILHWQTVVRVQGWASASTIFLASQTMIYVGTDLIALPSQQPYVDYLGFAVILGFIVTQFAVIHAGLVPRHRRLRLTPTSPTTVMIILLCLSLSITLFYISLLGQNPLSVGWINLTQGTNESVSDARLDAYATGQYFAPGYVNQFKNAVGPALGAITVGYLFSARHRLRWPVSFVIMAIVLLGLVVTAQRNPLFRFVIILLVYAALSKRRALSRTTIWAIVSGVVAFSFLSVIQGRIDAGRGVVAGSLQQLWERLIVEQQAAGLQAYEYVLANPQPLFTSWVLELRRLLPGRLDEPELAGLVANSNESGGTVPLTFLHSAQTALGTVGAMVFIAFFVALLAVISRKGLEGVEKTPLELIGIAGVFVTLGGWAVGGPGSLLEEGLAAYVVLWWWGARLSANLRDGANSVEGRPPSTSRPRTNAAH